MRKLVTQRILWSWIALLGVLFGALAPTVSHALAAATARSDNEVQVCTMEGMKTIVLDPAPAGKFDPRTFDHFLEHCPYCALHGGPAAPPPPTRFVFALLDLPASHPPLFYRSATTLFSWSPARPRGPPVLA